MPMRAVSSGAPLPAFLALTSAERALDRQPRPDRALGVVLLGLGVAKEGHQAIAEPLQHMSAEVRYRRRGFVEIGAYEIAPVFGVQFSGDARRADEIAEHHGDRATLG
jgi:hypothetical protein